MSGESCEGAIEQLVIVAVIGEGAAAFVNDRDNAVDVGVAAEICAGQFLSDVSRGGGGAVDSADDGDVVAGTGGAVAATIALKGACRRYGELQQIGAKFVAGAFAIEADVVSVNPLSGCNIAGGRSDWLSEFADCAAFGNGLCGNFVEQGHVFRDLNAACRGLQELALLQCLASNRDII